MMGCNCGWDEGVELWREIFLDKPTRMTGKDVRIGSGRNYLRIVCSGISGVEHSDSAIIMLVWLAA
jgi:hypothetical protein